MPIEQMQPVEIGDEFQLAVLLRLGQRVGAIEMLGAINASGKAMVGSCSLPKW